MSQMRATRVAVAVVVAGAATLGVAQPVAADLGEVETFEIENPDTNAPVDVVAAPDGSVWYATVGEPDSLGRISPGGDVIEAALPAPPGASSAGPDNLTIGPDGEVWLTLRGVGRPSWIARATLDGGEIHTTSFRVFDGSFFGEVMSNLVTGPDGNLWMVDVGRLWRYEPDADQFTSFTLTTMDISPSGLAAGSDDALWVTGGMSPVGNGIARVKTNGKVKDRFGLPGVRAWNPVAGPDGALWFQERSLAETDRVGRVTTAGDASFPALEPALTGATLLDLAADPMHSRLYAAAEVADGGTVVQIDVDAGTEPLPTERTTPSPDSHPQGLTVDAGGDVWWGGRDLGVIAKLTVDGDAPVQTFEIAHPDTHEPVDTVAAPDGSVWYTTLTRDLNDPAEPVATVGRISPEGRVVEADFVDPDLPNFRADHMDNLTVGPDGAIWWTSGYAWLTRATFDGTGIQMTTVDVAGALVGRLDDLTTGPDGNLWMISPGLLWRYEVAAGETTHFPLEGFFLEDGLAAGPDGALWTTSAEFVIRVGTDGAITDLFRRGAQPDRFPRTIVAGPDGALWYTADDRVGRVTTGGEVTLPALDPVPTGGALADLATDPVHDRLYAGFAGTVVVIDLAGGAEPYPTFLVPPHQHDGEPGMSARGVTVDAAGDVWWAESGGWIAKLAVPQP